MDNSVIGISVNILSQAVARWVRDFLVMFSQIAATGRGNEDLDSSKSNVLKGVHQMGKKTHTSGRDARSGRFITVEEAKRRPATTVIERVPNPGYGDTKPSSSKKK